MLGVYNCQFLELHISYKFLPQNLKMKLLKSCGADQIFKLFAKG